MTQFVDSCVCSLPNAKSVERRAPGFAWKAGGFPAFPLLTGSGIAFRKTLRGDRRARRQPFQLSPPTRAKTRREHRRLASIFQPDPSPTQSAADASRSTPTPTIPTVISAPSS